MIKKFILTFLLKSTKRGLREELNEIEKIKSEKDLLMLEEKYLKALLLHAYYNVKYYNITLNEVGIIRNGEIDLDKFSTIPILTKSIIRQYREKIVSNDYMTRKWYYNSSGGSTGEPVRFVQDEMYRRWNSATNKYYYQDMLGIDEVHSRKVILWGSDRDIFEGTIGLRAKIGNWLTNTVFLNSFRMTKEDMEKYIKIINQYKPELIRGYAGSLYELCRFAEANNLKIFTPKILVSAAETLTDDMREKIESVFGTKVYNFYGSREVGPIAGECKHGLMHIFTFNNYVETINHNKPVTENQEGNIIVTNLHNYSMPFIRYEIGDMAVSGPKKCKCGSPLPTFEKVTGRVIEHFIKKDGTVIPGEFFIHLIGVVCNSGFIRKFQVIQEDYERIRLLVVPSGTIDEHSKREITNKIRVVMGNECNIIWEFVDEIPKLKNGKYLYTQSLLYER